MNRTMSGPYGRLLLLLALLFVAPLSTGCGENLDPTTPVGAYNEYRNALFAGDAEKVWARLAPSTHEYFDEQHARLVKMDETIVRYLPATDHKLAREQAGSILTDDIKNGKGFFMKVFDPASVPEDEAYRVGMDVDTEAIAEDGDTAKITTRGGQTYILTKGEGAEEGSEEWFVMLVRSNEAVGKRLGWLDSNETALQKTVEDLIDEEKKKREALIARLMDVEEKKGDSDAEEAN